VTPEYNGGLRSAEVFYRYAEVSGKFRAAPGLFCGLSAGFGALRPVEQLQGIFSYRNAHIYPERVFLPRINDLLDETGVLRDGELIERLHNQARGFVQFIEKLKGINLRKA